MLKQTQRLISILFISLLIIPIVYGQVRTINDQQTKAKLKEEISDFRNVNDLQGISVAIIKDGKIFFKDGVGNARKGVKADGDTIYHAASVSKAIAGTLAVKLHQKGKLENGKEIDFNINRRTSYYLRNIQQTRGKTVTIPNRHKHTIKQLFSHLGCIKHYDGKSPVADYYPKAIDALPKIWNQDFVPLCQLGKTRRYSTHAFTYIAAALEQATGKTSAELIRSELAVPHNLPTLKASWKGVFHSRDPKLAIHYDENNRGIKLWNNSWKVFGGGLQISASDLARFGWKVRNAEIVNEWYRDNVLWKRVNSREPYGIAWRLTRRNRWRVAEHGGKWRGVRTNLRVYRDNNAPLVIAVMTNREFFKEGDLNTLSDKLADTILKIRRIR